MMPDAGGEPQTTPEEEAQSTSSGEDAGTASTRPSAASLDEDATKVPLKSKERKLKSAVLINKLLDEAREERVQPATDSQGFKLFREWENRLRTIERAKQMLEDAYKSRDESVVTIIKRMGPGPYRYKDKAYIAVANGTTIYLRELVARMKD